MKMKKFVLIVAFVAVTLCLITLPRWFGCGDNATAETTHVFTKVPSEGNEIEEYRKEYRNRLTTNTLKREEEIAFLENEGYYIYTSGGHFILNFWASNYNGSEMYFNPIVYQSDDGVEVWAIDKNGELCPIRKSTVNVWDYNREEGEFYIAGNKTVYHQEGYYGMIHHTPEEGEKVINANWLYVATYEAETGTVKYWELGQMTGQVEVPKNSNFVGMGDGGLYFKNGDEVWVVYSVRQENDDIIFESKIIAHNVKFFITSQYRVGVDEYRPLFLMNDGTLKTWKDYLSPSDVLEDVQYEGGYVATKAVE